jgi:hypothetical protein
VEFRSNLSMLRMLERISESSQKSEDHLSLCQCFDYWMNVHSKIDAIAVKTSWKSMSLYVTAFASFGSRIAISFLIDYCC